MRRPKCPECKTFFDTDLAKRVTCTLECAINRSISMLCDLNMRKAPTKKEKAHMSAMAATGCIICEMPAELHHPRDGQGVGMRASHMDVIPLCPRHHRHGGPGVAIHAGIKTFELTHGTERELLEKALKRLESYA